MSETSHIEIFHCIKLSCQKSPGQFLKFEKATNNCNKILQLMQLKQGGKELDTFLGEIVDITKFSWQLLTTLSHVQWRYTRGKNT